MDAEIKRIIRVETADGKESVKSLKDEIKRLKDALVNITEGSEDWKKVTQQLVKDQEKLTSVTNAGKKTYDAAKDSIAGMEKEYKDLYATYRLLTEEQRKSDFGKNMAKSLETLSNKLNDSKKEVGNYKDNIGRYSQGVMDAFSKMGISIGALQAPLKMAAGGVKTLGASLKALIANPVGAVIMAVVLAFKALASVVGKVREAIANNEEAQDRLSTAMSAFQPILDKVSNAWTALGNVVVKVIENISDAWQWIERVFSRDKEATRQRQELYKKEAQAVVELKKKKREYQKLNAEDEDAVARLREEAAETENLSKKKKLLTEAMQKEEAIGQRNVELAQNNLQILQSQASHTANSAEMNDKLAEAEAEVSRASAQAARNQRKLQKELNGINKSLGGSKGTNNLMEDYLKKVKEMDETIRKSNLTQVQKLEEERDAWLEIYKAAGKATDAVENYYQKQIDAAKKAQRKEEGQAYTNLINASVSSDEDYKRLGINGINSIGIIYDYLNNVENATSDLSKEYIGKQLEINIANFFTDVLNNAQEQVNEHFNWKFEDLVELDGADVDKLEQGYNNVISKMFKRVEEMGGLAYENEPLTDALKRIIKNVQDSLANSINETASKGLPISEEDQEKLRDLEIGLNGLINAYESLNKLISQNDEILRTKSAANYQTNGFFGTGKGKQDLNGFSIDKEANKLGKALYNSSKVWEDYGNAVTTVLDAVADAWQKNIEKKVEDGEISEEQAKSEFKRIKAMQYGLAIISTAAGVIQCFSDPSLVTWYAKAAAAASVLATGTAQVITIANTDFGSGAGSYGSSNGNIIQPQIVEQPPINVANTNTGEYIDALNDQRVYIVDSDIAAAGRKVERREKETTF